MAEEAPTSLTPDKVRDWIKTISVLDPELAQRTKERAASMRPGLESIGGPAIVVEGNEAPLDVNMVLETMVRPGRPVLPIKKDRVVSEPAFIEEPEGKMMLRRLLDAALKVNPIIPLVGRIDVTNFPRNASFLGTAWLVEPDVVVTNSHVAELIARRDGRKFTFLPGRFGDPIVTSVNWKREIESDDSLASPVVDILFIESRKTADIAFLKIKRRSDGGSQDRIVISETDANPGTSVAVIGYPARAGEDVIPDQAWMERVFGGRYDVKRAAPGIMTPNSRGWATHDCTTLGGNSGSVVIDLKSGEAVALHFAGAYVIENYAVPASKIRKYLNQRPWNIETSSGNGGGNSDQAMVAQTPQPPEGGNVPPTGYASATITLPLTITVSVGNPPGGSVVSVAGGTSQSAPIEDAVHRFAAAFRGNGIIDVRSGLVIRNHEFSDTPCINVVADPEKVAEVRGLCPQIYLGHPVDVRAAGVAEALGGPDLMTEGAVTSTAYNDDDRTGPGFSFDIVDQEMEVLCCVGPERSWSVLSKFIANAKGQIVSSIYEFHAKHIADAIEDRLKDGVKMKLTMDNATRVTKAGVKPGDFNRKTLFPKWANLFDFERIYVPEGASGLVADSYHIKVTVDDADVFWLSSGNWKNSSQPNILAADLNDPIKIKKKNGNREWHVVIKNQTLASRFRNHILADLKFAQDNGGREEAVADDVFVDVPIAIVEAVELEAARRPARIHEAKAFNRRRVKVKPVLTPDHKGKVYTEAVLDLINSAEEQLLFQIPYIDSYKKTAKGSLETLVKALIKKSKQIDDVRIILRSDHGTWIPCAEDLKKRGLNLNKCFKHISNSHTKGMIVDGRRVMVGSQNWSGGGVTLNRDASLIFDDKDIAEYYREAFFIDWERASRPIIPEAAIADTPRLADPSSAGPPSGFVRMTLEEFLEG